MKKKLLLAYGLLAFVMSIFVVRLIDIQLINGSSFADLADRNRTYTVTDPEKRGVFLDRYLQPLVFNKPVYYKLDSAESLYSKKTRISSQEAIELLAQDSDLIRIEHEREYRYPQALSSVLGYVGKVSVSDLLENSSLGIADVIGKSGLELELEDYLRGTKGNHKFEINALGVKQRLISQDPGRAGTTIPTTIDPYLSQVAYQALEGKIGSVIILDGQTGEVLTLVSSPSFDARALSESSDSQEGEIARVKTVQSFFSHPQQLFFNRATNGAYPPGSVFKLITALAALEDGKITKDTTILDEGVLKVGEYSYANWYFTQFGRTEGEINLQRSIARSNDIYFYKAAEWVGPEKIKEMAQLFGMGEKTSLELRSQTAGLIPDPAWKQQTLGERWFLGNTYHFGIGQGDVLVSPIQTAQMIQAIANKGTLCSPSFLPLTFQTGYSPTDRCGEVGVKQENLELVVKGMLDACSTGGTGFVFFPHNSVVRKPELSAYEEVERGAVACKTGTSEFGGADHRGYRKTHGWFVASFGTKELVGRLREETAASESVSASGESENPGEATQEASQVAQTAGAEEAESSRTQTAKKAWVQGVKEFGFPENLVIVTIIESDEIQPYKEGSKDAGPVVRAIFDWMFADILGDAVAAPDEIPEYSRE